MRLSIFLLILLLFVPRPLLGQMSDCTPEQMEAINGIVAIISEGVATADRDPSSQAWGDFHQLYWAEYAHQLPDCALGMQIRDAYSRRIDETLIARLYSALGDRERTLYHRNAAVAVNRELIDILRANDIDMLIDEIEAVQLGETIATSDLDRTGCAVGDLNRFPSGTDALYVVATDSTVPAGTDVFVRWYYEGEIYEDSVEITADRDYTRTCISFSLEADTIAALRSGKYRAEFVVNGNPAASVIFEID